jgi:hypothetical protein
MIDLGGEPSHFAEMDAQVITVEPAQYRRVPVVPRLVIDKHGIARVIGEPNRFSFDNPSQKRAIASASTPRCLLPVPHAHVRNYQAQGPNA